MHPKFTPAERERFWSRVDTSGGPEACWPWTQRFNSQGYGRFLHRGRQLLAHRVAWQMARGAIPQALCVLHNCPAGDNPACCNPAHLWLGTHAQNMRDMIAKGRGGAQVHPERFPRGAAHPLAKLTVQTVRLMRGLYAQGMMSAAALGRHFGCSASTAQMVVRGRNWKHVSVDLEDPALQAACQESYAAYLASPAAQPKKVRATKGRRLSATHKEHIRAGHAARRARGLGHAYCGEGHRKAKLTEEKVRELRERYAAGETLAELARAYGVYWSTACKIAWRRSWKHVL